MAFVANASKVAVGKTPQGCTNWKDYGGNGIFVDIDTSAAGFTSTPLYFTSLGGNSTHWHAIGVTAIYRPTNRGFAVYLRWADFTALTPAQANSLGWFVNWMGVEP